MRSRRLVLNTLANISSQFIAVLIAFVSLPLMLDAFGQSVYGVFLIASSTVGLVALFDFGVGVTTVRLVAAHLEREEPEEMARTIRTAAVIHAVIGLLASAALVACGAYAGALFRVDPAQAELLRVMLWVHAAAQIAIWPASVARHVMAGHERYPVIVTVSVVVTLGNALAIVGVLVLGQGPLVLTVLQAAMTVAGSLVLTVLALKMLPRGRYWRGRIDHAALAHIFTMSLPVFTIQIAAFVMRQQTDRLVLGVFVGAAAVAAFEAAAKIGALVSQMNELTTSAMLPYMTRKDAAGDQGGLQSAFLAGTRFTGILLMPLLAALAVLAPNIVSVWVGAQLGADAQAVTVAARILILSQVALVVYSVADPILIGKGRYQRWAPYAVALAALNLAISVALVGRFGVVGVALGTLIAAAVEAPLYLRVVTQELDVRLGAWVRSTLAPSLGIGSGVVVLTLLLQRLIAPGSVWGIIGAISLPVLVAYVVATRYVLTSAERATLRAAFSLREN